MTAVWSPEQLERLNQAEELRIAAKRADQTLRRWVPIWVVCAGEQVYVRTWYRRDSGWFAHVLDTQRARIQVPGLEVDVLIDDVGAHSTELSSSVDDAYRRKYLRIGHDAVNRMVTLDAAAATLRLLPVPGSPAGRQSSQ